MSLPPLKTEFPNISLASKHALHMENMYLHLTKIKFSCPTSRFLNKYNKAHVIERIRFYNIFLD